MSRFGPDPRGFFNSVYRDVAPWDVGCPQPAMSALLARHPPGRPVLDVGCGSGDLVIGLARSGVDVLGIDFAPCAIEQARLKASSLPPEIASNIELKVADGLNPMALGRSFGAVVDSGFLHLFDPDICDLFVEDMASVLAPGGRYYILAFAVEFPVRHSPRQVTEAELRDRFSLNRGWFVREIRPAVFLSRIATVPAITACFERTPSAHA